MANSIAMNIGAKIQKVYQVKVEGIPGSITQVFRHRSVVNANFPCDFTQRQSLHLQHGNGINLILRNTWSNTGHSIHLNHIASQNTEN